MCGGGRLLLQSWFALMFTKAKNPTGVSQPWNFQIRRLATDCPASRAHIFAKMTKDGGAGVEKH